MTLRRYAPLALMALAVGCTEVKQEKPTNTLVFATFDSTAGVIPTPNDLALQGAPGIDTSGANVLKTAQKALLLDFVASSGFPSDQEVSISIPFRAVTFDAATNAYVTAATQPVVDPATATASTVALFKVSGGAVTPVAFTAETDLLDSKVLKIRKAADATGSRRWEPGARYVVAVRGGSSGVKTTTGLTVNADQGIALVIPNKDMTKVENQPPGGLDAVTAAKLDGLRKVLWSAVPWCNMPVIPPAYAALLTAGWNPVADPALAALCASPPVPTASSAFAAISGVFPVEQTAAIATFQIAPSPGTYVVVDSGSGVAPLPFDLMREAIPSDVTKPLDGGLVKPNAAFGAAGAGLVTLDGFSTTAMILASTSGPITAGTVAANVKLYKRNADATWTEVLAVVKQPPQIQQGGFSVAIGLQPAVWTGTMALPPLAEDTKYAVVVNDGVTDFTGMVSLARSTFSKLILEQTAPVVYPWPVAQGTNPSTLTPLLAGMDAQTAAGIQKMRGEIDELIADRTLTRSSIAAAYTFKTQTVTPTSVGLAAAPYASLSSVAPSSVVAFTPAQFETLTMIPAGLFPSGSSIVTAQITTIDPMDTDPSKGTLNPNQAAWGAKQLDAIVLLPAAASVAASCPAPADALKCAPLVVFHHGLAGSRLQSVVLANALAANGFAVAAIDAPFHGGRAFCSTDAHCASGGTCTLNMVDPDGAGPIPAFQNQINPSSCTTSLAPDATGLSTAASGQYLISANFFRFRDAIREDVLDQSALVLALAPPTPRTTDAFATTAAGLGVAIDPTRVYYLGQSLGGIVGTQILATNPRYSRGVLNVPGGTFVDVFTTSPSFTTGSNDGTPDSLLELALQSVIPGFDLTKVDPTHPGFTPGGFDAAMAAAYLKTLNVAKWIIDPADPINYAANVETKLLSPLMANLPNGDGVRITSRTLKTLMP